MFIISSFRSYGIFQCSVGYYRRIFFRNLECYFPCNRTKVYVESYRWRRNCNGAFWKFRLLYFCVDWRESRKSWKYDWKYENTWKMGIFEKYDNSNSYYNDSILSNSRNCCRKWICFNSFKRSFAISICNNVGIKICSRSSNSL